MTPLCNQNHHVYFRWGAFAQYLSVNVIDLPAVSISIWTVAYSFFAARQREGPMEKSLTSTFTELPNAAARTDAQDPLGAELRLQKGVKRAVDFSAALVFLVLFSPLLSGTALLLFLTQGRPILFKHPRIGRNGEAFNCFKFRTMVSGARNVLEDHLAANSVAQHEWEAAQKLKDDPRITPLGRIMRKSSLDELPQFLNVLRGEMSLVGPRPIVSSEMRFYGSHIGLYHRVRPGITGLWQVSGRSNTSYTRRVELDVDYIQNWSLGRDIVILIKTIPAVLTSDGSC
jgi:exopolysaccharide production protein ExoY